MRGGKPNILIVITHDTGRELGCYGRGPETPHLDAIAGQGVLFTQAFCTAPQCSPSRASLLTGRYPHNHGLIGLTHRGFRLNPAIPTLPQLLAQAGYQTHLFGLQHESPDPKTLGYRYIHRGKNLSGSEVAPLVVSFLHSRPEEPFLAMVGFSETHRPFPDYEGPTGNLKLPPFLPDAPEIRRDVAALHLAVRRVDEAVGFIWSALQETKLVERTLFLFTTDHGIAFPGAKATLFEAGLEIALLMHGPNPFDGGKRVEAMVSNADLMPTLLEWLGLDVPEGVQGQSMLPLVRGEKEKIHDHLFFELTYHAAYDPMRAIRTERFKYIRSFEGRPFWLPPNVDGGLTKDWYRHHCPKVYERPRPMEMLFDLQNDPLERNDLAGKTEYGRVLKELREMVEAWMETTNDPLSKGYVPPPEGAKVTPPFAWDPEEGVEKPFRYPRR